MTMKRMKAFRVDSQQPLTEFLDVFWVTKAAANWLTQHKRVCDLRTVVALVRETYGDAPIGISLLDGKPVLEVTVKDADKTPKLAIESLYPMSDFAIQECAR